jgi:pyrroline-5-carboxylate reductase
MFLFIFQLFSHIRHLIMFSFSQLLVLFIKREAASAFASGKAVTQADKEVVGAIFGSVGVAMEVDEKLLDAVTGLSGSGPAYVFQFIEALSDGGVRVGLPRSVAMQLAA